VKETLIPFPDVSFPDRLNLTPQHNPYLYLILSELRSGASLPDLQDLVGSLPEQEQRLANALIDSYFNW
jgi:hypothetical protein